MAYSTYLSSSCFISDPAVFFGAFLGPIFAILLFNTVMFVLAIGVLINHTLCHSKEVSHTPSRSKKKVDKKKIIRLLIGIAGITFLFGLTWFFGALTVTGFKDLRTSTAFQALFVILNAFQGFFIFLFFCVLKKDVRELWLGVFRCGHSKSKFQQSSSDVPRKVKTASTNLATSNLNTSALASTSNFNSSTENLIEDDNSRMALTSAAAEAKEEKPSMVTFKGSQEVHETNIDKDQKADFRSLEKSEGNVLTMERPGSNDSEEHGSPSQLKEDGVKLKIRVTRYSSKKTYTHQVESAEVDFWDSGSDGSNEPDDIDA